MITLHKFPEHGRCGNRLFQYAALLGIADKLNQQAVVPAFPEQQAFKLHKLTQPSNQRTGIITEPHFHYTPDIFEGLDEEKSYSLFGYWQSKKYWQDSEEYVRKFLQFKSEFIEHAKRGTEEFFTRPTISIHIRRGDYVTNEKFNSLYYQLPITWFIKALLTIENWQEHNIIIFSDDIAYCKVHFGALPNVFFSEDKTPIEDICLMSLCDIHILSNSSFSWWGAYLSQQKNVIYPKEYFRGEFASKDLKDYWPENWNCYWPDNFKLDLTDCTFTIPIFHDSGDRKQNIDLIVCMIQKDFDTHISISEQGGTKFEYMSKWAKYTRFDHKDFHRTKMLNDMAMEAETPYILNWDADVIIAPMQVYLAVMKLREGADMVFPYDGRFARLPRLPWFKVIEKALDIGIIGDTEPKGKRGKPVPEYSVGGAVFFNKESFIEGGMENEFMISFGPEDCERNDRFTKLGFKIERVCELNSGLGGPLYHIDHWCGPDSTPRNPYFKQNHVELEKGRAMSKDELLVYVDTFYWRHKYTEKYYQRISPGSIESAKEIYKAIGFTKGSVIDVGAGVGEFHNDNPEYIGVDYKIPIKSLLIPKERYIDIDLEKETLPIDKKYDLCISLEVFEHISEQRSDILVEMLCQLSDTVLFSAAVPSQGGTGHYTERWQEWWADKFYSNGFGAAIKQPDIKNNPNICLWYRQNIVIYKRGAKGKVTNFILPEYYEQIVQHYKNLLNEK